MAQAPLFPVSAGLIEAWFPSASWPLVQGLQSMGLGFGSALTAPLIAWLMTAFSWQQALVWTTLPSLAVVAVWVRYARDRPTEHPAVSAAEIAELPEPPSGPAPVIRWERVFTLLRNRDILSLTLSYLLANYVYYLLSNWCFLYLVQERHFSVLEGGWLAATPPLAAALGAGYGGRLAGQLSERYGLRWGLRLIPLVSLPAAALLLFIAVHSSSAYLAVAALALCFASVELNEGPYWAASMHVAGTDTMAATGLLNTGGNVGGLIATPVVAWLSGQHQWSAAFVIGAGCAAASAITWLLVDPTRRFGGS
jgi:MFS transporter, ACS family, glucarate transporter